jgi:hypothetical protein
MESNIQAAFDSLHSSLGATWAPVIAASLGDLIE